VTNFPKILLLALSISASDPALAQQKFENLDRIDSLVAMTVGANMGEPGGPIAPVDRRLRLAACPTTPGVDGPVFGAAIVKCDALVWRMMVADEDGAVGQTIRVREDKKAAPILAQVVEMGIVRVPGFNNF
jgi:flagella basal body P-ring formation protein FlgA